MLIRTRRQWRNRAGSVQAQPNHYSYPVSFEEIQSEVLRAAEEGQRLRVAGSGRSFSPLCWTDENLMSLRRYTGIERWSKDRTRVWVRSGTRMGELTQLLSDQGLALENWQGPAGQTLGGAINTGAHSSSMVTPCLSAQISGLHLICADGSARTINAEIHTKFLDAARLSLGALGVITHAELNCVPTYRLLSRSVSARLEGVLADLPQHLAQNRSFSFRWFPYTGAVQWQSLAETSAPLSPRRPLHQASHAALQGATQWLLTQAVQRIPASTERAQHFSNRHTRAVETVIEAHEASPQTRLLPYHELEYALPLEQLTPALAQMERVIRGLKFSAHMPLEIRFSPRNSLWLSPAVGRDSAFIAIRAPQATPHDDYFTAMSEIADRHDGRPAWGSMHGKRAAELTQLYPQFKEFLHARQELDPRGVFLNPHLTGLFGIEQR